MANQFDEALVERLATELLASSFSHRLSDSEIEARKLSKPQEFEGFKADVETVLTALSETHVIVPKKEYYEDLKDAQRALDAVEEWLRSPMPDELPYAGSDGYRKAAMEVDEIISKAKEASPHA